MKFNKEQSIAILQRTPAVLENLLAGLQDEWVLGNEGPETFSPYDVVGHLIHGEKTDWRVRTQHILEHGTGFPFQPYNRFAQFEESKGKSMTQLLEEFKQLRNENLRWLRSLELQEADFDKKGMHPVLGEVTMRNLLAT